MHIILFLIGVATFLSVWYYRIQTLGRAAQQGLDVAKTAANLPRRLTFKYKTGQQGLTLIDDPREAVAIMMMEIARASGEISDVHHQVVQIETNRVFGITPKEASELAAHAEWVSNDAKDARTVMDKMSKLIVNSDVLGPREVIEVDAMLVTISEATDLPSPIQLGLLQVFRDRAGLRA